MTTLNSKSLRPSAKAQKSMRSAFRKDDEEGPAPAPVGHTKLDEDDGETSFAARIGKAMKKRLGR